MFHAGSLAVPFNEIASAYNKTNPELQIRAEQSGSLAAARKITELNKNCDLLLVADYLIIDNLIIPEYGNWNYLFAANEMIIAYTDNSKYADIINSENWHEILLKNDVTIGRSEPNLDPCGYRSLFVFKLAELYYDIDLLAMDLASQKAVIRPKEIDLIAFLETGHIDYLMIYKSVAIQHNLNYVKLPDPINLSNPEYEDFYNKVSTSVDGATKGESVEMIGSSIVYGFTIPHNHKNYERALDMALFITNPDKGGKILLENGMKPINKVYPEYIENLPAELLKTL